MIKIPFKNADLTFVCLSAGILLSACAEKQDDEGRGKRLKPAKIDGLVDITDILPTLADIAGITIPKNNLPLDGISFKTLLLDNREQDKLVYDYSAKGWHPTDRPWNPVGLEGEYDPVTKPLDFNDMSISVRNKRYKLLLNPGPTKQGPVPDSDGFVLIDIENDIREENNVIEQHAAAANELKTSLKEWFTNIDADSGSFKMPCFIIADTGVVLGYGPAKISKNLRNTCFYLGGWKEEGDHAGYEVDIKEQGRYFVEIHYDYEGKEEIKVEIVINDTANNFSVVPGRQVSDGSISLKKGKATMAFKISFVPDGEHLSDFKLKKINFFIDN